MSKSKTKVHGVFTEGTELCEKRFYLPGISLKGNCPKCQAPWVNDFDDNYLSYPSAGIPLEVCVGCEACGETWTEQVVLNISLKMA